MRTASAVGADTATITAAPIAAVFCTISTETRLVSSTMPSPPRCRSRASAPASLSSALWRPTSSRSATMPRDRRPERRGVHGAGFDVDAPARAAAPASAVSDVGCGERSGRRPRSRRARIASASDSMPHRPQPVGPAICAPPFSAMRSAVAAQATCAARCRRRARSTSSWDLAGVAMMPSVRLKPTAKSSRSLRRRHHHRVGAAVIGSATGVSSATRRAPPAICAVRARRVRSTLRPARASSLRGFDGGQDTARLGAPARHSPPASRSGRWTATPAPPSPCIRGSWSPSRNSRW